MTRSLFCFLGGAWRPPTYGRLLLWELNMVLWAFLWIVFMAGGLGQWFGTDSFLIGDWTSTVTWWGTGAFAGIWFLWSATNYRFLSRELDLLERPEGDSETGPDEPELERHDSGARTLPPVRYLI